MVGPKKYLVRILSWYLFQLENKFFMKILQMWTSYHLTDIYHILAIYTSMLIFFLTEIIFYIPLDSPRFLTNTGSRQVISMLKALVATAQEVTMVFSFANLQQNL